MRRAGIEPASPEGHRVTAGWHAVVPSDAWLPSGTGGSRTHTPRGLRSGALPVGAPCHCVSAPGGIRTRGLRRDRAASTPLLHKGVLIVSIQSARRESNPLIRLGKAAGQPLHHGRVVSSQAPGRSRTCAAVLPRRKATVTSRGRRQCPRQESNLVFNLRRVACKSGTPRGQFRAPGGDRTHDSGLEDRRVAVTPQVLAVRSEGLEPSHPG